jgi:hypothetical protein
MGEVRERHVFRCCLSRGGSECDERHPGDREISKHRQSLQLFPSHFYSRRPIACAFDKHVKRSSRMRLRWTRLGTRGSAARRADAGGA